MFATASAAKTDRDCSVTADSASHDKNINVGLRILSPLCASEIKG
jgi:hypothetical protein